MLRRYGQFLAGLLVGLLAAGLLLVVARRPAGHPVVLPQAPTPQPLRVYVTGAVTTPGVYHLNRGALWQDALSAAGGPAPHANLSQVNLARPLADGDEVLIPSLAPTSPAPTLPAATALPPGGTAAPPTSQPTAAAGQRVNINTASAAELDALPGIGPALAQRIVDYRAAHGPFAALTDLMQVSGIGPATFDKLKDLIAIGP